jgi:hypothetical protein
MPITVPFAALKKSCRSVFKLVRNLVVAFISLIFLATSVIRVALAPAIAVLAPFKSMAKAVLKSIKGCVWLVVFCVVISFVVASFSHHSAVFLSPYLQLVVRTGLCHQRRRKRLRRRGQPRSTPC